MTAVDARPDSFVTLNSGVRLCFRDEGPADGEPLLLVTGLGLDLAAWPQPMLEGLSAEGFRVIRLDNRDIGRSAKILTPPPNALRVMTARPRADAYRLQDMAADTVGLLDHLGIDRAHLVGMSMGGMIVQTVAALWPRRVATLTSMISTTGDPRVGQPTLATKLRLIRPTATGRAQFVRDHVAMADHLAGPGYPIDEAVETRYAEAFWDRARGDAAMIGAGTARQIQAIQASGDRTDLLHTIMAPTLVIHGSHDPIVAPSGGKATAAAIEGAQLSIVPGMGHHFGPGLHKRLVADITAQTRKGVIA
ncbi:alpha/beta fold hydrolase [Gordonia sp. NPDC003376]